MQQGVLYFNNRSNLDMNLYITDYPTIELNNEVYDTQDIEGRNGSVYIDLDYYKDRTLEFSFDLRCTNITEKLYEVKEWLLDVNDNRLIFNNDKCYVVKKVLLNKFKQVNVHLAELEVTFIIEPFLYDIEETVFTTTSKNFSIYNTGSYKADTIIKIYGTGPIQITCNGETFQIDDVEDYVLLDSKTKECVNKDGKSKDWDTIGNYITLNLGENNFELTGNVTKTEIIYRNTYL